MAETDPLSVTPITGIVVCCYRAASGHATAAPPNIVMKLRLPNELAISALRVARLSRHKAGVCDLFHVGDTQPGSTM